VWEFSAGDKGGTGVFELDGEEINSCSGTPGIEVLLIQATNNEEIKIVVRIAKFEVGITGCHLPRMMPTENACQVEPDIQPILARL
jgi:hypothetical protein